MMSSHRSQGGTVPDCWLGNRTDCGSQRPRTGRLRFSTAEWENRSDYRLGTGRLPVLVDTLCVARGLSRGIEFLRFVHRTFPAQPTGVGEGLKLLIVQSVKGSAVHCCQVLRSLSPRNRLRNRSTGRLLSSSRPVPARLDCGSIAENRPCRSLSRLPLQEPQSAGSNRCRATLIAARRHLMTACHLLSSYQLTPVQ